MTRVITKAEAERLVLKKDRTPDEDRQLGVWLVRNLQHRLTRLEPYAETARKLIELGKQDANESCRVVVSETRYERAKIIGAAAALATFEQHAEFRTDFEDIAARAEALL